MKFEDLEDKEKELSAKHGCKVHAMKFKGDRSDEDWAIGFIKEPLRIVKARAMDKMLMGQGFSVGAEIVEACLLKEESDPRILSEAPENDKYALGAEKFATDLIALSLDQSKKK
jgi:hypothetical protein